MNDADYDAISDMIDQHPIGRPTSKMVGSNLDYDDVETNETSSSADGFRKSKPVIFTSIEFRWRISIFLLALVLLSITLNLT